MTEYIKREEVEASINTVCVSCQETCAKFDGILPDCEECVLNEVKKAIHNLPNADVQPVVHGKWIMSKETIQSRLVGGIELIVPKCTACGGIVPVDVSAYKYCPGCGAKMEEKT